MSGVNKRKHVMREMLADNFEQPGKNQQIAKVISGRGNNLHLVEPSVGSEQLLVSIPFKFRKTIWINHGDFVIIETIEECNKVEGNKVEGDFLRILTKKMKGVILRILTKQHIEEFKKYGIWPTKFVYKKQQIAKVRSSKGNNLHKVEPSFGFELFLVSMSSKIEKNILIKRGDFVIIESLVDGDKADKVKGEIVRILTQEHITELKKKNGIWPDKFVDADVNAVVVNSGSDNDDDDDDDDDGLLRNTNRRPIIVYESSDSDDEDRDSDDKASDSDDGDSDSY